MLPEVTSIQEDLTHIYPCSDVPFPEELKGIGANYQNSSIHGGKEYIIGCVYTGEFRHPQENEWYLSGGIVEGYKAGSAGLGNKYHIARLVKVRKVISYEVVE